MAGRSIVPDRIMRLREFAQFAGVSYATAKLWIRTGAGPRAVRLPNLRRVGIRLIDYAKWLDRLPEREPTARPTMYRGRRRASPHANAQQRQQRKEAGRAYTCGSSRRGKKTVRHGGAAD
jgi:predicted DNA-binding transcriptional regulator AlpA